MELQLDRGGDSAPQLAPRSFSSHTEARSENVLNESLIVCILYGCRKSHAVVTECAEIADSPAAGHGSSHTRIFVTARCIRGIPWRALSSLKRAPALLRI